MPGGIDMNRHKSRTKGMIPIEKMHIQHIKNAIKKASKLSSYNPAEKKLLQGELKRRETK